MSSYGLILITVLMISILLLLTQPIGDRVFSATSNNVQTLIYNSGLMDETNKESFSSIEFVYKLSNGAELTDFRNVVKARINTNQKISHPKVNGFLPHIKNTSTGQFELAQESFLVTKDAQTFTIYYLPVEYTITYNTDGGEIRGVKIENYTLGSSFDLPTDVVKQGYKFIGWFEEPGLGGNPVTVISTGDYGNKIFYAKFAIL
jgi:uncharacterized repeat protein (TIGR02543 family)